MPHHLDKQQINGLIIRTILDGPTRVVESVADGQVAYAIPQATAKRSGLPHDIIYIRQDGWSLGAKQQWQAEAKAMWAGHWVACIDAKSGEVIPAAA